MCGCPGAREHMCVSEWLACHPLDVPLRCAASERAPGSLAGPCLPRWPEPVRGASMWVASTDAPVRGLQGGAPTRTHTDIHIHVCRHTHVYTHRHAHMCTHLCNTCACTHRQMRTVACRHFCTHVHRYVYTHVYAQTRTHMQPHKDTHVSIHA